MTAFPSSPTLGPDRSVLDQLRERVRAMEREPAARSVAGQPGLPGLDGLVSLQAGASYAVDSASLALALAAGASRAGEWVGFAGCPDFGVEAAAELGVELSRTVVVPDPGEHWLEVTAALVDVLRVVVLRAPTTVDRRAAGVLDARLRKRSAVLVVHGHWPRAGVRVSVASSTWTGLDHGVGHLTGRRAEVLVQRGARPPQRAELTWPGLHVVDPPEQEVRWASG